MTQVQVFEVNPFAQNMSIVFDETGEAIIFDPGMWDDRERAKVLDFLTKNNLTPVRLINTHGHLDHVFSNSWVANRWNLPLEAHRNEAIILQNFEMSCQRFGLPVLEKQPEIGRFLEDNEQISFGNTILTAILAPGHSPGSLCFYCEKEGFLIGGDVLFYESIGRTDLPGGDHETLISSIRARIFTLPGETVVYPGHGQITTIRHEMEENPFL
jgi:hydroxyacylglutathione hydrolase